MIGIYALYWPVQDLVYVGQSVDVDKRIAAHRYRANRGKDSMALNTAFRSYGEPEHILLEECALPMLDTLEIQWIQQFDRTLNTSKGGTGGSFGTHSGKCDYTEQELVNVLKRLQEPDSLKSVSESTGVSISVVESIAYRKRHGWLSELYPELYENLPNVKRFSSAQERRYKTRVILVAPDGCEHIVTNLSKFAAEHDLNKGHLCAVVRGNELSHKGWKRKEALDGYDICSI